MLYREVAYSGAAAFCVDLFTSHGFSRSESALITDVLLCADLWGIESHGIQRLMRYHNEIKNGMVSVKSRPELAAHTPVSAVIDGCGGMGQLISVRAMNLAIKKAKTSGVGMVAVRNSNHYGIAGYYTKMAVKKDLMGICMTNTEAIGVPLFGKKAMLGTNPISLGFPAEPVGFIYDAATTVVPRGKVEVYSKSEKPLPDGWAVDAAGQPASDAAAVLENIMHKLGGGISPLGGGGELLGGHKGYGLGIIVDLFTGILSSGKTSNHLSLRPDRSDIAHFFMAVDYGIFGDKAEIKAKFSTFLQELRDSPKADGQKRIYTHGEKEAGTMAKRRKSGTIPISEKTLGEMREIAGLQKLSFPAFL
ncbi:MAG: Ldh family oxidoreductase [Oscillospiraceae bacterium]|nr:Ldh family oxidoreductase [Oscillospiraceae bacterium]